MHGMLYVMPGTEFDKVVSEYPEVLIPFGGHWYVQPEYVPGAKFWHTLLNS